MIRENVVSLLAEIPPEITVVAAAKSRGPAEILEAIEAGIRIVGENYVQEAERAVGAVGRRATWHLIGRLQRNKASRAAPLFDLVETVDSLELARALDRACERLGRVMPVLIEVNSGREAGKAGVLPQDVEAVVRAAASLAHLEIQGLMTLGPLLPDPQGLRPYFRETRGLFERLRSAVQAGREMTMLSMGMSDSYRVAIEEGATVIRVGTRIFGPRPARHTTEREET